MAEFISASEEQVGEFADYMNYSPVSFTQQSCLHPPKCVCSGPSMLSISIVEGVKPWMDISWTSISLLFILARVFF